MSVCCLADLLVLAEVKLGCAEQPIERLKALLDTTRQRGMLCLETELQLRRLFGVLTLQQGEHWAFKGENEAGGLLRILADQGAAVR